MKQSNFETKLQIFIGHAKKRGATEEELETLVKTMDLIKKYLPINNEEES